MGGTAIPALPARSDVELAAEGDHVAFGRLVTDHQATMSKVAFVIVGDRSLAQDATQAAWIAAWKRLGSVRDPAHIRAWLVSVTANEARQLLRRRGRTTVVEIDPGLPSPERSDPAVGIARLDLANALAGLSADDRALLALRYVAGLDAAELGTATGRTASGTRARLSRLTARLRAELDR
jgi:RNA polymerase sigma-70 factor (ECF subfamily)